MFLSVPTHVMTQQYWILLGLKALALDLNCIFISPLEENHVSKLLKKKIQKGRVENAMKNGGQRIAIDFTLSEDMSNKVNTVFLWQFVFHFLTLACSFCLFFTLSAPFIMRNWESWHVLSPIYTRRTTSKHEHCSNSLLTFFLRFIVNSNLPLVHGRGILQNNECLWNLVIRMIVDQPTNSRPLVSHFRLSTDCRPLLADC